MITTSAILPRENRATAHPAGMRHLSVCYMVEDNDTQKQMSCLLNDSIKQKDPHYHHGSHLLLNLGIC
jgi:hypothetical protein